MILCLISLVFLLRIPGSYTGSMCYTKQTTVVHGHTIITYTLYGYCDYGCCGYTINRYCCADSTLSGIVWIIIGATVAGVVFLSIAITICFCCVCKCVQKKGRVQTIQPTRTNNVAIVQPVTMAMIPREQPTELPPAYQDIANDPYPMLPGSAADYHPPPAVYTSPGSSRGSAMPNDDYPTKH